MEKNNLNVLEFFLDGKSKYAGTPGTFQEGSQAKRNDLQGASSASLSKKDQAVTSGHKSEEELRRVNKRK